jgi:hypothetical protein
LPRKDAVYCTCSLSGFYSRLEEKATNFILIVTFNNNLLHALVRLPDLKKTDKPKAKKRVPVSVRFCAAIVLPILW